MGTDLITRAGPSPAPLVYELGATEEFQIRTAYATFDGTNASGAFLPCLTFYSQSGAILNRVFPDTTVAAGDVANVSYAPFQRRLIAHKTATAIEQIGTFTSGVFDGSGSTVVQVPAGTQVGDMLLMFEFEQSPYPGVAGFTVVTQDTSGGPSPTFLYRIVQAGDPTSYTVTDRGGITSGLVFLTTLRNVDQGSPIAASGVNTYGTGGAAAVESPSVTTGKPGCYLAVAYTFDAISFFGYTVTHSGAYVNTEIATAPAPAQQALAWVDDLQAATPPLPSGDLIAVSAAGVQPAFLWGSLPAFTALVVTSTIAINPE